MRNGVNMLRQHLLAAIALLALLMGIDTAAAEEGRNLRVADTVKDKRIALVIGNGAYVNSPLKNPVNDAKDMAKKLRSLGFDVIERSNLQTKQIGATLREFRSKLAPGAVALVFYAGHGLQIKGINYLPAVDADINSEEDVPNQSIAVNQIMDVLDESKTRLNLVFLDACRNNPYARSFRSSERGLARVSAPSGTLISYATRPGSVAADGEGRNGLYTGKLLAQMDSNLQIEQTLKRVVTEVKAASQGKQEPWMEGSIEGDFCFAECVASSGTASMITVPARIKSPEEIEQDAWESVRDSENVNSIREYLNQYPQGRFARQAKILMASLQPAQPAEPTPVQPPARFKKSSEEIEDDTWSAAEAANTAEAANAYLTGYPKGRYVTQARVKLASLKKLPQDNKSAGQATVPSARDDDEIALWNEVKNSNIKDDYDAYLSQYPKGKYVALATIRINKLQDEVRQAADQLEKFKSLSGQWLKPDGSLARIDAEGGKLSIHMGRTNFPGSVDAWVFDEPVNRPNFFEIVESATIRLESRGTKLAGVLEIPGWAPSSLGYCALPGESNQVEGALDNGRIFLKMKKMKFRAIMNRNSGFFDSTKVRCDEVTPAGDMTVEMTLIRGE